MLEVLARGEVNGRAARGADAVGADAEDHGRAVEGFRDRNYRYQRVNLADLRIVFEPNVEPRMQAVDERHARRGTIDLPVQQPDPGGKFFWVIGRPPDSLAFARSDGSSGH